MPCLVWASSGAPCALAVRASWTGCTPSSPPRFLFVFIFIPCLPHARSPKGRNLLGLRSVSTLISIAPAHQFCLPENCSPPSSSESSGLGYDIVNNISRIARLFGSVMTFRAYLDISVQSSNSVLRSELQSSGVSIIDCPHNNKKDVVDKMILGMCHNATLSPVVERSLFQSGYACIRCRSFRPRHNHPGYWRS